MDRGFEAVQEQIGQRFDAVGRQLDELWAPMLVMIAGIFGLIRYIIWERNRALRLVEQRLSLGGKY